MEYSTTRKLIGEYQILKWCQNLGIKRAYTKGFVLQNKDGPLLYAKHRGESEEVKEKYISVQNFKIVKSFNIFSAQYC